MKNCSVYLRFANRTACLVCSLAFTMLLAGSWQVRAQSPTAAQGNRSSVSSGGLVTLAAHTAPQVLDGTAMRLTHYSPEQKLRLVLAVQPPHMAEEEEFIKELTAKGSPNFHKFLTPEEWNARFAPSAEDEQKVVDWAKSQGLTVTNRYPNRLLVDLEATSGVIETAFGVTINNYQVGDEVDFANDRDPVLPASLSGIVYNVQGLNNIQRDHGSARGSEKIKGPDYAPGPVVNLGGSGHRGPDPSRGPTNLMENDGSVSNITNGEMDPSDLYSSQTYNYNGLQRFSHCCNVPGDSGGSPRESSIAIAGFGEFLETDIDGFASAYGLWFLNHYYYIDGTGSFCNTGDTPPCATGETTEDIEWSVATANSSNNPYATSSEYNTAQEYIYLGANQANGTYTDIYNQMVTDNTARVMTTSWSCTEVYGCSTTTMAARHAIFVTMVGEGWTLIAASGDRGATDDCNTAHIAVAYPASDPLVVAAGGTQLSLNSDGTWAAEQGWTGGQFSAACSPDNDGGSGGGVSAYFPQPTWQSAYPSVHSLGSMRLTPDLSLNAAGIGQNLYINGSMSGDGNGTSVVAPELAGFFAQENSYLDYIGDHCGSAGTTACSPVGDPHPILYELGNNQTYHYPYYDITTGCNSNNITTAGDLPFYCAGTGFDLVTGWGTANMMQLAWGINWQLITGYGLPSIAFTGPAINTWYNTNQEVSWTVTDVINPQHPGGTPSGVAGFTQGWDSITPDTYSEKHGGVNTSDSFYYGPYYAFGTTGCLAFVNNGCSAAASPQGCHTVNVRAWDNQGVTTESNYGPLCYDTVAPTISISTNPVTSYTDFVNKSVVVTLTATDPGGSNASGIKTTYYAINSTSCYPGSLGPCTVYTGPFTVSGQQQSYIYYFTEDNAGNFSAETYQWVSIDLSSPVTTPTLTGSLTSGKYYSDVQVTLSATDSGGSGIAATYYELDGGAQKTYAPFTVSTIGSHSVKYWSVNGAGTTASAVTTSFTIAGFPSTMNTPASGATLGTSSVPFTWTAGTGVTQNNLWLGLSGPGSSSLYVSGWLTATTSTTVTSLPAKSATVYARLYSMIGGVVVYNDYTYTEAGTPAAMSTPVPGSTLGTSAVEFTWTPGYGATEYNLWLGLSGPGSSSLYTSGWLTATTSTTVTSLPAKGATVYARLYSMVDGKIQYNDYTYIETQAGVPATMSTPASGSTLGTSNVQFTWTTGTGATEYNLWLGLSGPGSSSLYTSGWITATSTTVASLPAKGATVYARLYSMVEGKIQYNDYTYTEQ
jgi:subtilase family serine protease